jgi:hypothetical protein
MTDLHPILGFAAGCIWAMGIALTFNIRTASRESDPSDTSDAHDGKALLIQHRTSLWKSLLAGCIGPTANVNESHPQSSSAVAALARSRSYNGHEQALLAPQSTHS